MTVLLWDEHVRRSLLTAFRRAHPDIPAETVQDLDKCGASDAELLDVAIARAAVIVTQDLDFIELARQLIAQGNPARVILLRPGARTTKWSTTLH